MPTLMKLVDEKCSLSVPLADKLIEHEGELYEGEKEGGDLRNETVPQKRPANTTSPSDELELKKSKLASEEIQKDSEETAANEESQRKKSPPN